jgi:hypothetical protein
LTTVVAVAPRLASSPFQIAVNRVDLLRFVCPQGHPIGVHDDVAADMRGGGADPLRRLRGGLVAAQIIDQDVVVGGCRLERADEV